MVVAAQQRQQRRDVHGVHVVLHRGRRGVSIGHGAPRHAAPLGPLAENRRARLDAPEPAQARPFGFLRGRRGVFSSGGSSSSSSSSSSNEGGGAARAVAGPAAALGGGGGGAGVDGTGSLRGTRRRRPRGARGLAPRLPPAGGDGGGGPRFSALRPRGGRRHERRHDLDHYHDHDELPPPAPQAAAEREPWLLGLRMQALGRYEDAARLYQRVMAPPPEAKGNAAAVAAAAAASSSRSHTTAVALLRLKCYDALQDYGAAGRWMDQLRHGPGSADYTDDDWGSDDDDDDDDEDEDEDEDEQEYAPGTKPRPTRAIAEAGAGLRGRRRAARGGAGERRS